MRPSNSRCAVSKVAVLDDGQTQAALVVCDGAGLPDQVLAISGELHSSDLAACGIFPT